MSLHEALARMRISRHSSSLTSSIVHGSSRPTAASNTRFCPCTAPASYTPVRHATHGAQGRANGPKNGAGKRLGAKKTGEQYVIPGNIIYRQRGTLWFPGENVGMGRDHTIFARESGYVKYYRDPLRHPDRKYIGVAFERNQRLPTPLNAARRRRLSMVAVPRADLQQAAALSPAEEVAAETMVLTGQSRASPAQQREARRLKASGRLPSDQLRLRPDYSYRESNYDIGRAAERAGVPPAYYKPGNRFAAWRKRGVRRQAAAEKRSMARKAGPKKSKK